MSIEEFVKVGDHQILRTQMRICQPKILYKNKRILSERKFKSFYKKRRIINVILTDKIKYFPCRNRSKYSQVFYSCSYAKPLEENSKAEYTFSKVADWKHGA